MPQPSFLSIGLECYRAGDRETAAAWFDKAVAAEPDEPTGLFLLGLVRFETGDREGASRLLERVVELRPEHAKAWLTLAILRHVSDDNQAAADAYRRAADLDPGASQAWVGLSQSLLACGETTAAADAAERAVAAAPSSLAAHLALGAALSLAKRPRPSADAYRRARELSPESVTAHIGLAVELLQLGEAASALDAAQRAVALDESIALAWSALGAALRRTGDWRGAIAALERALALNPRGHADAMSLGTLYALLDLTPLALRWLTTAVELAPDDCDAHAALSSVCCSAGSFDEGRMHAQRALALNANLMAPHQNLARIFASEGDHAAARRHRDLAYAGRSVQIADAPNPVQRVLLLSTTGEGNTPDRHLLPPDRYTRLYWYVAYANPAETAALPDHDVVFNGIGDQDETGPTAQNVAQFIEVCRKPLFNRPEAIARTRRDLAPSLFAGVEGLVVPKVARLSPEAVTELGLLAAAERAGVGAPIIVRPTGSHGGQGVRLISPGDDDASAAPAAGGDQYVTQFHDYRSPDGLYRKYRILFVDRRPYPYHLAIGPRWMVHYQSSGAAQHPERIAEERRFLEEPHAVLGEPAMETIRAIGARLDLDFAGVDFALRPDGRVLLFEANATMLVHPEDPSGQLAHKNAHVAKIVEAFQAMLRDAQGA